MNKKKTFIVLIIFCVPLLIAIFWMNYSEKKLFINFGRNYDSLRKKYGVPIVEKGMKIKKYSNEKVVFTFGPPDTLRQPYHLRKILKVQQDSIISENDEYYNYVGENESSFLNYEFSYVDKKWNCYLLMANNSNALLDESYNLDIKAADSVLTSWGLKRTSSSN